MEALGFLWLVGYQEVSWWRSLVVRWNHCESVMAKQVCNEVVENDLVYIKSAVICNKNNHVDDTLIMCWFFFFYSVFMLHVLFWVGLHHSVGQCGDLSICGHSALLTPLTITSKKQWHQMVDLHCIELLLLWHELNAPWWACGSCACSGLCLGKCDNRLHASH
jgi:hypothetical protein